MSTGTTAGFVTELEHRLDSIEDWAGGKVWGEVVRDASTPYTVILVQDPHGSDLEVPHHGVGFAAEIITVLSLHTTTRGRPRRQISASEPSIGSTAALTYKLMDQFYSLLGDRNGWLVTITSRSPQNLYDIPAPGLNPPITGDDIPAVICAVSAHKSRS